MNILITNDDGYDSPGIYALARQFMNEGEVVISAPDRQRSASSHSITMHNAISAAYQDFFDLNLRAYAVSGTPVDCVKLAYEKFMNGKIDLILSGVNDGGNLGNDVIYSGTVSAAIEGAMLGIPSIAVSLVECGDDREYYTAAKYAYKIYKKYIKSHPKDSIVLNVNVPGIPYEDIKGITGTSLGNRKYSNEYKEKKDPEGNILYWLSGDIVKTENGKTTDIFAIENNYVSITPMHFELTKFDYIDIINSWFNGE